MSSADRDPTSLAEELFAELLAERDESDEFDVELECREHPALADALRTLHERRLRGRVLEQGLPSSAPVVKTKAGIRIVSIGTSATERYDRMLWMTT